MKLIAIPGWACDENYFDFINGVTCFNWGFYSDASSSPEEFLKNELTEDFIFIAYSLGSLYVDLATESPYCKGLILLSGFCSFCGQNNEDRKILDSLQQMTTDLNANPTKLVQSFQALAGSRPLEKNSFNTPNLAHGLKILKTKSSTATPPLVPTLLIRGRQDRILHPRVAMQLERSYPSAERHCLHNQKHDLSQSPEVRAIINNFLEAHNA
jgi:pimeloyl-ACP methyl ester carboxylesterase